MIAEALIVAAGLFLAGGRIAHAIRRASRELRDELAGAELCRRADVFPLPIKPRPVREPRR